MRSLMTHAGDLHVEPVEDPDEQVMGERTGRLDVAHGKGCGFSDAPIQMGMIFFPDSSSAHDDITAVPARKRIVFTLICTHISAPLPP